MPAVIFRRLVVAAILSLCIGAPIVEMFDRWDRTLQDGSDTEANAVIVALCVGAAMAIGTMFVVARIRALSSNFRGFVVPCHTFSVNDRSAKWPTCTSSPPTLLRV